MKLFFRILLIINLLGFMPLKAQVEMPSYIFYNEHHNLINPAAVGTEKGHTISVDIRNQWQGLQDAPQTQTFFTSHKINDRIGLGFSIANNKIFIQKQAGIFASFAYSLPLSDTSQLLMGISFGGDFYNIDGSRIQTYTSPYGSYYDPYLQTISGKFQLNVGTGLYYQHSDFFVGISAPNLLASDKVTLKNDVVTSVADRIQFYGIGGYFWKISYFFKLKPSVQLRMSKDVSPSFLGTLAGVYNENAELGISYRTDNAISGYVLFTIPSFFVRIGYGYESNLRSGLNLYARNSHEFLVQFKW